MSAAVRLALAVIVAWLMPWRAAARIRSQQESIGYLLDVVLAMDRQQRGAAPARRHLRAVK